jgi:hypothetical protein
MSGFWSRRMLGKSVVRWLSLGRKRENRPVRVRPSLESLEKRDLFSISGLVALAPSATEGIALPTPFTVATFTGTDHNP